MSSDTDSHRLTILTREEIDELYGLPRFTDDDRRLFFELSPAERAAVDARTISVATYLALELGYFKAKRQFFTFEQADVIDDLRYLLAKQFPGSTMESVKAPSKPTHVVMQRTILDLFGYRHCDSAAQQALEDKACRTAMLSTQPLYILRESLQYLANERIVPPRYTTLQDMVGRVVTYERNRVADLLALALTPAVQQALEALLQTDEQMYRISALKREPKDFSHKELKREVERRKFFQPLHEFAQDFLVAAGLSNESGKYYASLVKFYTAYKLQRMPKGAARLYLLCFAFHRFRQINDNLIEAFIHLVSQYEKQAKHAAEAAMQQALLNAGENLRAAGEVLHLFIDKSISGDSPFATVQEKAFSLLKPESFSTVADYLRNIAFDKTIFQWSYYSAQWERSSNLRPYKHLLFLNRPIVTNGALPPALKTLSVQPARGHCFSTISAAPVPSGRLPGRGRTGHRGRPTPASGLAVPAADGIARASCRIACCWWSSARCAGSARADRPAPPRRCWRGRRLPAGRGRSPERSSTPGPPCAIARHAPAGRSG
jgi:hypothetical protein